MISSAFIYEQFIVFKNKFKSLLLYDLQVIYEHYFWAMVSAVYCCLKKQLPLNPDDVQSAIELFCEESTKEIDITSFLRTLCNHYRNNTLIVDQCSVDDVVFPEYANSVGTSGTVDNKPISRLQKRSSSGGSSSFKSSHTSLRMRNGECGNVALANVIKNLFTQLLGQYFQQVPSNPYYMFFNEDEQQGVGGGSCEDADDENETDSQVKLFFYFSKVIFFSVAFILRSVKLIIYF